MRRLLAPAAVAAALLAAGCGGHTGQRTTAETEGLYLDVGEMTYQVQISRYMNPNDAEDRGYFVGLPEGVQANAGQDNVWFGVFMRVQNPTPEPHRAADTFVIEDTQENRYRPVPLADENLFAYRSEEVPPESIFPNPDSIAGQGPVGLGRLLLFRLESDALQNRPLKMLISQGSGPPSEVILDV